MDPFLIQMLSQMQGTGAMQPGFDMGGGAPAAGAAPAAAPGGDMAKMLGSLKSPEAQKPIMNAGVSGAGLPFMQQMPNTLAPAMDQAQKRVGQMPSLGQILMGNMR